MNIPTSAGRSGRKRPTPLEKADPPRPVRGLRWVFVPTVPGRRSGPRGAAYYAAAQRLDPATPIWVGGAIGLGIGAFLWAVFPYKGRPRQRPICTERDPS